MSLQGQAATRFFVGMLVLSLFLHTAITFYVIFTPQEGIGTRSVSFLDLSMVAPASPVAVKAAIAPSAAPETLPDAPVEAPPVQIPSEFEKLQKDLNKAVESAKGNAETIQQSSLGLGITRGFFRSLAEGESLRADIRAYYFSMLQNINEKWWIDKGIERKGLRDVVVNVIIARNGEIVDKQMVYSSGNPAYDRAVLKSLEAAAPLPPLPESYPGDFFQAPIRLVAPLNLLAS